MSRETFDSPLFGTTGIATDDEVDFLRTLAEEAPVALFQALNIAFNQRGLMLNIDPLPEQPAGEQQENGG